MQKFNAPASDVHLVLTRVGPSPGSHMVPEDGRKSLLRRHAGFVALVVTPTLLAILYFFGLAADRYETQAQYVLRVPGAGIGGPLQSLVQSGTVMRSADDAYITHAYMQSRDAMNELLERIDLVALLGKPKLDFLWRYPPPFRNHNQERLYQRLKSHIQVAFDRTTGITTLKVQAFTPDDSQAIAKALLENAERLVNRLSERGQHDAVASAQSDVAMTRQAAVAVQERITDFRRRNSVVDPGKVSVSAQETIARLALESAQIGAQVRAMQRASPNNPQMEADKVRVGALEEQILKERQRLAGSEASLAPLIAEYESLVLERQFTEQTFGSALAALEVARADGLRQRLFLEQISAPHSPDYASYPYRLLSVLIVLVVSWSIFSVVRRFVIDARRHAEL